MLGEPDALGGRHDRLEPAVALQNGDADADHAAEDIPAGEGDSCRPVDVPRARKDGQ